MVTFEYKGVVEMKGETKAFGQNGFTKRDLVVGNPPDSPSMYPNPVLFTFKKDRCALDGRKWDGPNGVRYFTDLTGWKIEVLNANGTSTEPVPAPPEVPDVPMDEGDPDNLPF